MSIFYLQYSILMELVFDFFSSAILRQNAGKSTLETYTLMCLKSVKLRAVESLIWVGIDRPRLVQKNLVFPAFYM